MPWDIFPSDLLNDSLGMDGLWSDGISFEPVTLFLHVVGFLEHQILVHGEDSGGAKGGEVSVGSLSGHDLVPDGFVSALC